MESEVRRPCGYLESHGGHDWMPNAALLEWCECPGLIRLRPKPITTYELDYRAYMKRILLLMKPGFCGNNLPHGTHYWGETSTQSLSLSLITNECEGVIEEPCVDKQCLNPDPHRFHIYLEGGKHYDCAGLPDKERTAEELLPQKAIDAFKEAWEAKRKEIGRGIAEPGTKTRAGLTAALDVLYELGDIE